MSFSNLDLWLGAIPPLAWTAVFLDPSCPWKPFFSPRVPDTGRRLPRVRILVPARNEEAVLPQTLPALLQQDYPGDFDLLLIDDRSQDGTGTTARSIAAKLGLSERLQVVEGSSLPEGWTGKLWALEQGWRQTEDRSPEESPCEFFLLTDADILHGRDSLRTLVEESLRFGGGLNSRMAKLHCRFLPERLLIPPFLFFFSLLYPMRRINQPRSRRAGAAGGCILLSRRALQRLGGFPGLRGEIIDDLALARAVKGAGFPIHFSLAQPVSASGERPGFDTGVESLRKYPTWGSLWKMVSRSAFAELRYSWLRLLLTLCLLFLFFSFPLLLCLEGLSSLWQGSHPEGLLRIGLGLAGLILPSLLFLPTIRYFGLPWPWSATLPFSGLLYGLITAESAWRHLRGKDSGWRATPDVLS
ncbi:hypothetical protein MAMC_01032 [Methylacidimicrobium cyclopophantes]|uniref:Uncharacterized protein n=1 Tax=Methylacidimicrobium cyclopophantes TaxID=1041766 RepID=A0A5E6MA88_9BACT|nr:glycosyltransferase [Methylacidimicrobium cyclopophantes]VVM06315.1 hypothetical protein MAMC_01032 [Methylacidimicrobium cyclopophantes]